jgi:hypothetical protein
LSEDKANLRDREAQIILRNIEENPDMCELMESHVVCRNSVIDSVCLDAFPACMCADRTACLMACRNVNDCGKELGRGLPGKLPFSMQKDCDDICDMVEECIEDEPPTSPPIVETADTGSIAVAGALVVMLEL